MKQIIDTRTAQREYIRCLTDDNKIEQRGTFIYFIENYLSTFNADERKEVPFKLFPRQKVYLKSLVDHNNTIAIKHRQCGVTTISSAWVTGRLVFASKESPETVLCIGNKLDISQQLIEKIGAFLDQVPRWMWGPDFYSPDPDSEKNKKSIYKSRNKDKLELFNGCKVYARSSGENAARGISAVSILIFDEAAFIQNSTAVYTQAVAATASVRNAKIIMVSTPNGKDQLYYKTYAQALEHVNNYNPVEFKWFQDLRYNRNLSWSRKNPDTGELETSYDPVIGKRGEIEYNEERWRRLEAEGWIPDSPWYTEMCKSFNGDEQKIAQELNVSFLGSSDNVVPSDVIEMHRTQNVVEITEDWPIGDRFIKETWIWKLPEEGHRYICTVDSGSGSGADRTAIEIIDVDAVDENGKPYYDQVLEYYGKRTGDEIGEIIFQYASTYNNALVVLDGIGGYSDAAILTLLKLKYPNMYYDDPGLKTYTVERRYEKFGIKDGDKLPGFRTNSMRTQMFTNFVAMIKENTFRIRSSRVITELETWIFRNGRMDHADGAHDDSIYALAMGLFVLQFSMLRSDDYKSKNKAMVSSWIMNGARRTDERAKRMVDSREVAVNDGASSRRQVPSYRRRENAEKNLRKGCMMLGGVWHR